MPLYDIQCSDCGHLWEERVALDTPAPKCAHCESNKTVKLPPLIGGYQMSGGGGSTRPRHAGSFKKVKS